MVLASAPGLAKGPPGPTDCHRCWVMTDSGNPDIKWWSEQQLQKGRIGLYLQIIGYELPCQAKTSQTERIAFKLWELQVDAPVLSSLAAPSWPLPPEPWDHQSNSCSAASAQVLTTSH